MVKHMYQVKEGDFMVGAAARYVTVHEDRAMEEVADDIRQGINEMIAIRAVRWKIAGNRRRVRLVGTRNWFGPGAAFAAHLSIRAHHEQTLMEFAGLNLTHRLDMLICVVGTTNCLRPGSKWWRTCNRVMLIGITTLKTLHGMHNMMAP
jgi:hypothetical protein